MVTKKNLENSLKKIDLTDNEIKKLEENLDYDSSKKDLKLYCLKAGVSGKEYFIFYYKTPEISSDYCLSIYSAILKENDKDYYDAGKRVLKQIAGKYQDYNLKITKKKDEAIPRGPNPSMSKKE